MDAVRVLSCSNLRQAGVGKEYKKHSISVKQLYNYIIRSESKMVIMYNNKYTRGLHQKCSMPCSIFLLIRALSFFRVCTPLQSSKLHVTSKGSPPWTPILTMQPLQIQLKWYVSLHAGSYFRCYTYRALYSTREGRSHLAFNALLNYFQSNR